MDISIAGRMTNIMPAALPNVVGRGDSKKESEDKVTLKGADSIGEKILNFPKNVAKAVVGSAFAVASAVIHTPAGTAEGISESLSMDCENVDTGWFTAMTIGEFIAGGAAAGFAMSGPLGLGIGAGTGLVLGCLTRLIEEKAGFPDRFVGKVEEAVDEAIKDNKSESKIRLITQNLTEGAITGTIVGFKESLKEGYQAGGGIVEGVCDVFSGFAQGIKDSIKNKH